MNGSDKLTPDLLQGYPRLGEERKTSTFELNDPALMWYVEQGAVDVFTVGIDNGQTVTPYKHMLRATPGSLVFGIAPASANSLQLRAKALPDFSVRLIPVTALQDGSFGSRLLPQVETWIEDFTQSIISDIQIVPFPDLRVDTGMETSTVPGCIVSARNEVAWMNAGADASYLGSIKARGLKSSLLPVTRQSWINIDGDEPLQTYSTEDLLKRGILVDGIQEFHRIALEAEQENQALSVADIALLQLERTVLRQREEADAKRQLKVLVAEEKSAVARGSHIFEALKYIGAREHIEFTDVPETQKYQDRNQHLSDILLASGVRAREVRLQSNESWWHGDNGTLLGFRKETGEPVALIPSRWGRYRMVNPQSGARAPVTEDLSRQLEDKAWVFYSSLPQRSATTSDALRLLTTNLGNELAGYMLAGLLAGLISFAPALILGFIADSIVPSGSYNLLFVAIAMLVYLAVFGGLVQLFQSFTLVRAEGRGITRITAALWERLISLRSSNVKGYVAGDLCARAMVFQNLRDTVSGSVANALTSMLFLLPALALLFFYEAKLAGIVAIIGLATLAVLVTFGLLQLKWHEQLLQVRQSLNGSMYEFINAIGKIQKAGAIGSVFATWARRYQVQKDAEIRTSRLNEFLVAFGASIPLMATAFLLGFVGFGKAGDISVGSFLTVYAASMVFFSTVTRLGAAFATLASIVPSCRQVKPILELVPESGGKVLPARSTLIEIKGDIRLDQVSFRYEQDGPLVLDDISMHFRPGEFVAIVGASGCGKSTIFRILLGLETPSSGSVYYDNQNLTSYNLQALRQQVGVVAQDTSLLPGSILQNITGIGTSLTLDDAWVAARQAVVDDDINSMPMGMHTAVGEDATLFSGGQQQRLHIASALARHPRVLFLDEATNWMDNDSQARVMKSIDSITATRIVIAHRLTTIREADRIYVMGDGKILQQGSYPELAGIPGPFQELISRQTA